MSEQKSPKKGGIKLQPLRGQFFDIKPAATGTNAPQLGRRNDYFLFAFVTLIAFLFMSLGNAYVLGREIVFQGQTAAYEGYENIKKGAESLLDKDPVAARRFFAGAEESFNKLKEKTDPITSQSGDFDSEGLYLDTADKLIASALDVAGIGRQLSDLMLSFSELPQTALLVAGGEDRKLIEALMQRKEAFDSIVHTAAILQRRLSAINESVLPDELRQQVVSARGQTGEMMAALMEVDEAFEVLLHLLGDDVPHRYLLLFQNNHERRATGGFIGSYMILDFNDGVITKMEAKDVYETDGQLHEVVEPPPGIDRVADRLYMRDANYSPDFPTSARDIMWFLEHSKGPSVDTVIAIDQNVVESLLELTGPVVLPSFPFQIRAENFSDILSFYTEAKLSQSATPKQLLFDLIPVLRKKLPQLVGDNSLLERARGLAQQGHVQAYSVHPEIQRLITRVGLDGTMISPQAETDYLSVISTSIGGNKSDEYMTTELAQKTTISAEGVVENALSIRKIHRWDQNAETKLANLIGRYGTGALTEEAAYFILGRGPNLDYMRVYVPKGSLLQQVSGLPISEIEVYEDQGYTVFAFVNGPINAGDSKEVTIRYRLPESLALSSPAVYRFVAENQAGAENVTLKKEVVLPEGVQLVESEPAAPFTISPVLEAPLDAPRHMTLTLKP